MVSIFSTMLSCLFLASVVNANDVISKNEVLFSKNLMTAMKLSPSWLRPITMNNAHRYARHLQSTSSTNPCTWDENNECHVSESYTFSAIQADPNSHPAAKKLAEKSIACRAGQGKTACEAIVDCHYNAGKCEVTRTVSAKLMHELMGLEDCGNLATMFQGNGCSSTTDPAQCSPTTCNWVNYTKDILDKAGTTCVRTTVGECQEKPRVHDPNDPWGIKAACPKYDEVAAKAECDVLTDNTAKWKCYGDKCPTALLVMGHLQCRPAANKTDCDSVGLCSWDTVSSKCEINPRKIYESVIPPECGMRDYFLEMMDCGGGKNQTDCESDQTCQWTEKLECRAPGAPPTKESRCEGASGSSHFTDKLGTTHQEKKCTEATTKSTCESVAAEPFVTSGTSTSTPVGTMLGVMSTIFMIFVM